MSRNKKTKIIWQPQPGPQTKFCASDVFEVFYGGAAGGGKTDALLMEGLRQAHISDYRAIVFRRTTKQLRKLIDRAQEIFPKAFPGAKWSDQKLTWRFPSGAKYMLWHMEHEKNKYDHDGQEYQYIGFDEITHFSSSQYAYLYSRCRSANPDLKCYIRASGMPIGPGLAWVKQRFIDNGAYNVIKDSETGLERVFIPATLDDNIALMKGDPDYERRLQLMGPKLYHALRYGDWSVVEGAYFEELNQQDHSCPAHMPPPGAMMFRAMDWGYATPFSVGWYYEDYDGNITRFLEWYGWTGKADEGLRMGAREVARKIKEFEKEFQVSYGVADPSIWSKADEGPSIAENMADEGVLWEPAINDRVQGWMEVHNRLRLDDEGRPRFKVTENCKQFWRTVPLLQSDPNRPEDLDTKMEDHVIDEVRYALMSRPCLQGVGDIILGDDRATANMDW
jgi:hypothetical protein